MKTPVTTVLSVAGVLVAGVAAAAVNTQALQSRAVSTVGEATASLVVDAAQTPAPLVETVVDPAISETTVNEKDDSNGNVTSPANTSVKSSTETSKPAATSIKVANSNVTSPQFQDDEDDDDHEEDENDEEEDELD